MMVSDMKKMSTTKLVELFIMTESMPNTPELPTVRGWIMDALEAKDPKAFDEWMDAETHTDAEEIAAMRKAFNV